MGILFVIDGALGKNKTSVIDYINKDRTRLSFIPKVFHFPDNHTFHKELSPDLTTKIETETDFKRDIVSSGNYYYYEYDERLYGFKKADVEEKLEKFKYVFVIVRSVSTIQLLKQDYGNKVVAIYIHTDVNIIKETLEGYPSRSDNLENAWNEYVRNAGLYDDILVNNDSNDENFNLLLRNLIQKQTHENPDELRLPSGEKFVLTKDLIGYKEEIRKKLGGYEKNVFLMMKFRRNNANLSSFIKDQLTLNGFNCIRADDQGWNITDLTNNPIAVLYCCKYGIALFDEPEEGNIYSPNVAYELGIMHSQRKECLILKHTTVEGNFFDLVARLHKKYTEEADCRKIISNWVTEISS
jgi:guanylate kinase